MTTLGFLMFDPVWFLFMVPGLIIGLIAQSRLNSTYSRYLREPTASGMSGAEAARQILDREGLQDIPIEEIRGQLTDHYDPLRKRLCLSSENYRGRSIAAVGVAAHEAGHALQQKAAYAPLNLRMALVPMTNFGSGFGVLLVFLGVFWGTGFGRQLAFAGIGLYALVVLFQLITLPVEYDASRRAKERLLSLGLVTSGEHTGVNRMLNAAALTYVAGLVTAVLQLFYLLSLVNRRN